MSILRNDTRNRYTVISQTITRDSRLPLKERGMLLTLLSLPDNWEFSVVGLCKILCDGQTAITSALKSLEQLGYLKRNKLKDVHGRFYDVEWLVFEEPQPITDNEVSPHSEITDTVSVDVENRPQSNTTVSNPKGSNPISIADKRKTNSSFDANQFYEDAKSHADKVLKGK